MLNLIKWIFEDRVKFDKFDTESLSAMYRINIYNLF